MEFKDVGRETWNKELTDNTISMKMTFYLKHDFDAVAIVYISRDLNDTISVRFSMKKESEITICAKWDIVIQLIAGAH